MMSATVANIAAVIEDHAENSGERLAFSAADTDVTYAELRARVRRVAGALARDGIGRGDVVGVLLFNRLEVLDLLYATAYLGAVFMPLNWRLAPPELSYILNHAGARMLVSEAELIANVEAARDDIADVRRIAIASREPGWRPWEDFIADAPDAGPPVAVAQDDLHRVMYTSGTTSRPKGVTISHSNLTWKNRSHAEVLEMSADDRGLVCGPLYHVGALDLTTTTLLHVGGTSVVLPKFDSTGVLDAIEEHGTTVVWLAPAMVRMVLDDPSLDKRDLGTVRLLIGGGEKMPLPLIDRIERAFPNAWFADAYGLTETVSGDTFLGREFTRTKVGSVGKAVPHHEVAVLDDHGHPASANQIGEIVVRGPKVTHGYWRDPEATAQLLRDGWLHTGDLGELDEDGFLYIVDRLKDIIISGGENVASLEVERVLYEHPDVREAAVVGRPDPRWNEVPVAYVMVAPDAERDADALRAFCIDRLAGFKVPAEIRFVEELPRNPSGKVLKRALRDLERPT